MILRHFPVTSKRLMTLVTPVRRSHHGPRKNTARLGDLMKNLSGLEKVKTGQDLIHHNCQSYLKHCLRLKFMESRALYEQEQAMYRGLSRLELELQGLAIFDLRIEPGSWKVNPESGTLRFRVFRAQNREKVGFAKTFKIGHLLNLGFDPEGISLRDDISVADDLLSLR